MKQDYQTFNTKEAPYLRKQPEILELVQLALGSNLSKDFGFVGEQPIVTQAAIKRQQLEQRSYGGQKLASEFDKVVVFVIGGITRAEISALQNLEKTANTATILIGSTGILTSNEFFNYFENKSQVPEERKEDEAIEAGQIEVELRKSINEANEM